MADRNSANETYRHPRVPLGPQRPSPTPMLGRTYTSYYRMSDRSTLRVSVGKWVKAG
jgi:hypothetical protein